MRTHLAIALALCAALAAPAGAQNAFAGRGFLIALPYGYPAMEEQVDEDEDGGGIETFVSARDDKSIVMVMHVPVDEQINDTTLATRRALLQLARAGMDQAQADMRITGEPREVVHEDRVALRMPVKMEADDQVLLGRAEVSVPRRGDVAVWMIAVMSTAAGAELHATAERVMNSFRLSGPMPPPEPPRAPRR